MNILFEEIFSMERREIVRYYKNKKIKRSISLNLCNIINNINKKKQITKK